MPWSFWTKTGGWVLLLGLALAASDPAVRAGCSVAGMILAVWVATDSLLEVDDAPEADD
jgi:lysozyme family protein